MSKKEIQNKIIHKCPISIGSQPIKNNRNIKCLQVKNIQSQKNTDMSKIRQQMVIPNNNTKQYKIRIRWRKLHNNLRENDIVNGILLCYHYRIISKENCINKLKKAQYLKFKLEDLMLSDYPEIIDETLKNKFSNIQKL